MTSVKTGFACSAIAAVTGAVGRDDAAEGRLTGSHACALRVAPPRSSAPTAMPHGLACLMIATVGWSPWSWAARTRGVGVDVVVVGHLLAVQLLGLRDAAARRVDGRGPPAGAGSRRSAAPPRGPRSRRSTPGSRCRRSPSSATTCAHPAGDGGVVASRCARTPRPPAAGAAASVKPPAPSGRRRPGVCRRAR